MFGGVNRLSLASIVDVLLAAQVDRRLLGSVVVDELRRRAAARPRSASSTTTRERALHRFGAVNVRASSISVRTP